MQLLPNPPSLHPLTSVLSLNLLWLFHINGIICDLLYLASFTLSIMFEVHLPSSVYQYDTSFLSMAEELHCMDIAHFVYPFIY